MKSKATARHKAIIEQLQADKARKAESYDKTIEEDRQRTKSIIETSLKTPQSRVPTRLEYCPPSSRFEILGLPSCRGCLISVSEGSARVIFDDGTDTRISPSTEVFLGAPKALSRSKQKAEKPAQTGRDAVKHRPRIFGYTCGRIIYALGAKGWKFEKLKQLFEAWEVPIADSTTISYLKAVGDPKWFNPAPLTDVEFKRLEISVE